VKFCRIATAVVLAGGLVPAWAADDAEAVLAKARAIYATANSYQDDGHVEEDVGWDVPFTVSFVRPGRLRVHWTERGFFYFGKVEQTLVADGRAVRFLRGSGSSDENWTDLEDGVAASTGVSHGVSQRIATLLIPDLWKKEAFGRSVLSLDRPALDGTERVDGIECDRVKGTHGSGRVEIEVWIGVADHLIRRIDTRARDYTTSEVHRHIRIDAPVSADVFVAAAGG
jgi:outer membrane lipoprotein-sorting protein